MTISDLARHKVTEVPRMSGCSQGTTNPPFQIPGIPSRCSQHWQIKWWWFQIPPWFNGHVHGRAGLEIKLVKYEKVQVLRILLSLKINSEVWYLLFCTICKRGAWVDHHKWSLAWVEPYLPDKFRSNLRRGTSPSVLNRHETMRHETL